MTKPTKTNVISCFELDADTHMRVSAALSSVDGLELNFHKTLGALRREILEYPCDLILGPWQSGRDGLARTLTDLRNLGACKGAIALVPKVTPSIAEHAALVGGIELVVASPLNALALRHRVITELEGVSGLARHLYGDQGGPESMFDAQPALRKRLAA